MESSLTLPPSQRLKHLWPTADKVDLLQRDKVRRGDLPFEAWLPIVSPAMKWGWSHLLYIQAQLERFTRGEIKKLMLFIPPRHGKSELVTIRYSVYRLEVNPAARIAVGAYSQDLANRFSRKARKIARERIALNPERSAVDDWETVAEGGFKAVGVGSGVTGRGADLVIIDDPIKGREEAESLAYRERVWEWYTDDIYTRLEPNGQIILIQTRWHQDDLAGRILDSEDGKNWAVITLPAEAEENDPLGREVGEALCPERYDKAALRGIYMVQGSYGYSALYQQRPAPREGNMFKRAWFEIVNAVPADAIRVRFWDKAASDNKGDYTAGVKIACSNGIYYIEDVVRGQWSSGERDKVIRQTAVMDGRDVTQYAEEEPGSSGKDASLAFVNLLVGFAAKGIRSTGDKVIRADAFASQAEVGNVKVVKGEWNRAFLEEITSFPTGAHDDQVDGASGAFNQVVESSQPLLLW